MSVRYNSQLWNNQEWWEYYDQNQNNLREIPWNQDNTLSRAEYQTIKKSIATFQLGENAEGKSFKKFAAQYIQETGDKYYELALDLFIKEEQRHSSDLGRFMDNHNIPRLQKEWTDSVFRYIRKLLSLELEIMILVSAEYIAKVYYRALMKATESPVLQELCKQILSDEVYHIYFQSAMLAKLRRGRHPLLCKAQNLFYKSFFFFVVLLVWHEHRPVFKRAKFGFFFYLKKCFREINRALEQVEKCNKPDCFLTTQSALKSSGDQS